MYILPQWVIKQISWIQANREGENSLKKLHYLDSSQQTVRFKKWKNIGSVENIPRVGEEMNAHNIWIGEYESKNPLGRTRSRWDHITIVIIWLENADGFHLAQDWTNWLRLLKKTVNLPALWKARYFLTNWATLSFTRSPLVLRLNFICKVKINILSSFWQILSHGHFIMFALSTRTEKKWIYTEKKCIRFSGFW